MAAPGPGVVQTPQPPSPQAIAVADYLRSINLKSRTCILQGQRKELFKVKRALRAFETDHYKKAQSKNPLLPPVADKQQAVQAFGLLPRNLLALRVSKVEPQDGQKPAKRVKGLWTVKVEQQQEIRDELYYAFFYEPRTWKQTAMAFGLVVVLMAVVLFPLWPPTIRLGVWYLSMGMLGLIGLFIAMSIFRLILFLITMVVTPPGLWLYPNLFEDVGFFDSFRPVWAWHKVKGQKGKKKGGDTATASANSKTAGPVATKPAPPVSVAPKQAPPVSVSPARPKPTVEDAE